MSDPLLDANDISKSFGGIEALSHVSLKVNEKERLGLIGPNGSGKTTLLNVLCGVYTPGAGTVTFRGVNVTSLSPHHRTKLGIARTFQIPRPFSNLSVLDNVKIAAMYRSGRKETDRDFDAGAIAVEQLRRLGLESKIESRPRELTQIEMRKMELGRALATGPRLLLLDEVMAGLTSSEVDEVLRLLQSLHDDGITILMVEHIMRAIVTFCDRVVVLSDGKRIADGATREVVNNTEVVRVYLGE